MSKIEKNITVPKDSSIKIEGPNLTITGPKGTKNCQSMIRYFHLN